MLLPMTALRAVEPEADRLGELAAIANAEHELIWRAGREALEHAVKAGKALLEAQAHVQRGEWLRWLRENVTVHATSAYKYMRLARFEDRVLAEAYGVEHGLRIVAEEPWHDRTRLSDADKAEMVRLVKEHTLGEVAQAFGVAESTVWRWTSDKSPARQQSRAPSRVVGSVEITDEMIESAAGWLCKRFSDAGYFARVNDQVRADALELIGVLLGVAG